MAMVVVGIDGSDGAQDRAVMAWDVDTLAYGGDGWGPTVDPTGAEEGIRSVLDTAVDEVDAEGVGAVRIERVVATGPAAEVLIEQARGADMLVVGSRGRGGLLHGSVGQQCAPHALCPVTIVPGHERAS
jgi:nucleotide-binding universal stress UspA family protein